METNGKRKDIGTHGDQPAHGRPGKRPEHTGSVIVRLAANVDKSDAKDLLALAKSNGLKELHNALEQFGKPATRKLIHSMERGKLLALEAKARRSELPPLRSLSSYWRVDMRDDRLRLHDLVKILEQVKGVDHAYAELDGGDPVVNDSNDTYAAQQTYLDAAPTGIDARWAWTQPNGEGTGVAVVDMEQGWFLGHEDLPSPTLIHGDNRDGIGGYKGNHGTAVLGEIAGVDNARGIVGGAPSVASVRVTSHYEAASGTALHVADAIVAAIAVMNAGDVLLLEVQRDYLPTEVDDADFDAIRLASALGIIVVEAAGNGNNDLDAYTNAAGDRILDRGHADFRDSGAIMVGAGESAGAHQRSSFSCYGSRIDCFAWGDSVVTAGYGDLDAGTGDNSSYTDAFSGTSSASPIIVVCAALVQGMYEGNTGGRLSPLQMRSILSDPATGTAQGAGRAGNINVMPDLRAILGAGGPLDLVPDVYMRDQVGDDGSVPSGSSISASPDVIVQPTAVADPTAAFGEGSGTENSNTLGYQVEAGQDNFVHVRLRNRGSVAATSVRATVYWSEVSTLVAPGSWNLIGTTAPIDVPAGDVLVVTDALVWSAADIPATGHYCFVAIAHHAADPAPPTPPTMEWSQFYDLVRNNNNVVWRNFNVVDVEPDPSEPSVLRFNLAGAFKEEFPFDLEILLNLPLGPCPPPWFELPIGLGAAVAKQLGAEWKADRKKYMAMVQLPKRRRIFLKGLRLPKDKRIPAAIVVHGAKGVRFEGHGVAVRQLVGKEEAGRVSWVFRKRRKAKH
ncbi:MAG: S8 family serine peptidase [Flavobacteriales bacterium]|nr:MAG: S8 family serine peptidase [Flavobacteriales bacterium]